MKYEAYALAGAAPGGKVARPISLVAAAVVALRFADLHIENHTGTRSCEAQQPLRNWRNLVCVRAVSA